MVHGGGAVFPRRDPARPRAGVTGRSATRSEYQPDLSTRAAARGVAATAPGSRLDGSASRGHRALSFGRSCYPPALCHPFQRGRERDRDERERWQVMQGSIRRGDLYLDGARIVCAKYARLGRVMRVTVPVFPRKNGGKNNGE